MRSTWLTSGSLSSTHNSSESAKSLLELQRKGHAHQRNTRVDLAGQEHWQVGGQRVRREEVHVAHTALLPHSPPPKADLTVTLFHSPCPTYTNRPHCDTVPPTPCPPTTADLTLMLNCLAAAHFSSWLKRSASGAG